ncbi:glutaredoxin 3 [Seongchinamella sediminis]|uniref:Glutaredoxin n=1 Tax=Seongchinamella sediminis TaxID=2283635 RepID=A0A3L7E4R0_9GAMM|nr:glutaredoxin 3 [Seongchinamella sediminis]RLQ23531.1 glutaredoxin 3 [Seongchinamella sediminis]
MSSAIVMYSTRFCPYCVRARMLLESKHAEFTDIGVDARPELRREMMQKSGRRTVPQIWIGERHVGGYDDLARLEQMGELDDLLKQVTSA